MSDIIPPQWNRPKENPSEQPASEALDFWECMQGICLRPYKTIRRIVNQDPQYGQIQLFVLLVLSSALQDLKNGFSGLIQALLIYVLFFAVSIYPTIAAIWFTGKQLKGKANFTEIHTAFLWAMSPAILGNIVAFAISAFVPEWFFTFIAIIFFLFGLKLTIATLAEVQGFSFWESVWNQFLALLLLAALLMIPLIIFSGLILAFLFKLAHSLVPGLPYF